MEKSVINVPNVPRELLDKAKTIAEEQDRPLAQVIRELLRAWVAEQEHKQPNK